MKPGGAHIMLMGLTGPLKEGDTISVTLDFEKAGDVTVEAKVAPIGRCTRPSGIDRLKRPISGSPVCRHIRIILWIAVAVALFGARRDRGQRLFAPQREATTALQPGAPLGGAFSLIDQRGEPVTEAIFREKPSVTLFGFTHCPDVCPTGLMEMAKWAEELGPDADKLRFVFVTVDPERDTPEVLRDYIERLLATASSASPARRTPCMRW